MITYSLPYPPTVNGLFVEVAGKRIKTRSYREWRDEAGWAIKQQRVRHTAGPVRLMIQCVKPDNRKRDISNLTKAVEDLLVEMRVIDDDSMVMEVTTRWVNRGPACLVTVFVSPAELSPVCLIAP